jgi:hypothetical protein
MTNLNKFNYKSREIDRNMKIIILWDEEDF